MTHGFTLEENETFAVFGGALIVCSKDAPPRVYRNGEWETLEMSGKPTPNFTVSSSPYLVTSI